MECINGGEDALKIYGVVRIGWGVLIDGVLRRIDIQSKVNPSGCKCIHAVIVICGVIDGVDANGINFKLLKPGYTWSGNPLLSKGICDSYSAISRVQVALSAIGSTASDEPPGVPVSDGLVAELKACFTRLVINAAEVESIVTSKEGWRGYQHACH